MRRHVYIPEEQPDELLVVVLDGPVDGCEAGEVADGGGEGGAGGQLAPHRRHVAAAEVQQPRDVRLGPLPLTPSQGLAGHLGPGEQGGCSKELLNTFDYFHFKTRPLHAMAFLFQCNMRCLRLLNIEKFEVREILCQTKDC